MIRLINTTPIGMYMPLDEGQVVKVERARGVAFGRYFVGLFFFGDEWAFTVCGMESLSLEERT